MSTVVRRGSAFPRPVADLVPQARILADRLGGVPSRNRIMAELRIGAAKAKAVRTVLQHGPEPKPEPKPELESGHGQGPGGLLDPGPGSVSGGLRVSVDPDVKPGRGAVPDAAAGARSGPVSHPAAPVAGKRLRVWPVWLLALPAFVSIWSGWVGLGGLTGFGTVHPLPGIWDSFTIDTAITLPVGVETYAAFALYVWLSDRAPARARRFAKWSTISSLLVGAAGQVAYHLMAASGVTTAPWPVITAVSCLPVAVLGMGAALGHLLRSSK